MTQEAMVKPNTLSSRDLQALKAIGISRKAVLDQLARFAKGFPFPKLKRVCKSGDGITRIAAKDYVGYRAKFLKAAGKGRVSHFIPASGAATRMFKSLSAILKSHANRPLGELRNKGYQDPDILAFLEFYDHLPKFAFYEPLKEILKTHGLDLEKLRRRGDFKTILNYLLTEAGLNYANCPKGLIPFHRYPGEVRTPFQEHLMEALSYSQDARGRAGLHFTVPKEWQQAINKHLQVFIKKIKSTKIKVEISVQNPATDTVAVDESNELWREKDGSLVFRPSGHGALLQNLNEVQGDIVFIKNIDNIAHARLRKKIEEFKRILGGYLVAIQEDIYRYLKILEQKKADTKTLNEISEFAIKKLGIEFPVNFSQQPFAVKKEFFISKLNRPVRVCGMVANQGEPGGGPFWIEDKDGIRTLQIIESAQVHPKDVGQLKIWKSSKYFNPVDLVCGLKDFKGHPFNLQDFVDPETGIITDKSKDGRHLKALELPGLWNGGMADWNTAFVEVPIETFNPVKTVNDLLRPAHQPS